MGKRAIVTVAVLAGLALLGSSLVTLKGPPDDGSTPGTGADSADSADSADGALPPEERSPRKRLPDPSAGGALDDLAPTDEEYRFLRAALTTHRAELVARRIATDDSALELLGRVTEHGADPAGVMWDFARFRQHVRTGGGAVRTFAATGDFTQVNLKDLDANTGVLEFGPGRFRVSGANLWKKPTPPQLEIRGAGMDATTLVLWGDLLTTSEPVENLTVRGLTFETRNDGLDLRGAAAVILEDVRLRPPEGEAAGGALVSCDDRAYLGARNCEFAGLPGSRAGSVVRLRAPSLVLFAGCKFTDLSDAVQVDPGLASGSVVHFTDCTFDDCAAGPWGAELRGELTVAVSVRRAMVRIGEAGHSDEARMKLWGRQYLTEATGVTLGEGFSFCTLGELLAVTETAAPPAGQRVLAAWLDAPSRTGPLRIAVLTGGVDRRADGVTYSPTSSFLVEMRGAAATRVDGAPRASVSVDPREVEEAPPLAQVIRQARLPAGARVWKVSYGRRWDGSRYQAQVELLDASDSTVWTLDAATGELLRGRRVE